MKEEKVTNCIQCVKPMENSYGNEHLSFPFCNNHKCPNYALLQTGVLPKKEVK